MQRVYAHTFYDYGNFPSYLADWYVLFFNSYGITTLKTFVTPDVNYTMTRNESL